MRQTSAAYSRYFREELRINVGIQSRSGNPVEVGCVAVGLAGDLLDLEICGDDYAEGLPAVPGAVVHLTAWTGWSLCRCNAVFVEGRPGRRIHVRLTGPVVEKQSREYFRLDVSIPIMYAIQDKQLLSEIQTEWSTARELIQDLPAPVMRTYQEGYMVARWDSCGEIMPQRVNLSGGGLRFRTREYVEPLTYVGVNLFLPGYPHRVIPVVAEALRCSQIVLGLHRGASYNTAMRFHFIEDADREAIISFIFTEQRRVLSAEAETRA